MKIKVAKYIAEFLADKGVTDMFTVTGGGAMHLNDAFGHSTRLKCTYNHHEQACAIAAEGYARLTGRVAGVCVTSGPGGTNALTGVLGGWLDSIPMFIVSGQVKRETTTWASDVPLRQLGDQEFQIAECVKTMTKYSVMITDENEIRYHLEKAWFLCNHGRKGPVWIDVPLDVQAAIVETDELKAFDEKELSEREIPVYDESYTQKIIERLKEAKRPVLYAGTGIRLSGAHDEFLKLIDKLGIPVVSAWNAHDVIPDESPYYCGRPGTVGIRGGNFVVENADLLLVLGCRLNIRLVSYNYKDFAKNAYKIIVDIDENELKKPTVKPDMPIHADVADVMRALNASDYLTKDEHKEWLVKCRCLNEKYPAALPEYFEKDKPMNPYAFFDRFFKKLDEGEHVVTGNGSACVITFQTAYIKPGQRLFTNSGCASMGYGFPAAIGCAVADKGKRVICIEGDGSLQMNIQELQTVVYNKFNIKLLVINNKGYHSIRQTQSNLFKDEPLVGIGVDSGLSFPEMEKIAYAYGIPFVKIDRLSDIEGKTDMFLNTDGPVICEVVVDETQFFEPKLSSKVLPDGKIVSPPIDDMYPFLSREEYEENKKF